MVIRKFSIFEPKYTNKKQVLKYNRKTSSTRGKVIEKLTLIPTPINCSTD